MSMTHTNTVIIMVGLPASGKSTARANSDVESFHYSTDDIVERMAEALGVNYDDIWADSIKEATAEANAQVVQAIAEGRNVLWDQTNMSRKKRRAILNQFPITYQKQCVCILPPHTAQQELDLTERLTSRPGKKIPGFVLKNMRNSFQLPSMDEGFDHVFYFDIYGMLLDLKFAVDLFGGDTNA